MKVPKVIVRKGDRFIVDEARLLPALRHNRDLVNAAVSIACQHYKDYPDQYKELTPEEKLEKMNSIMYEVLSTWGIYKGKKK